jgi:hypothetical protein
MAIRLIVIPTGQKSSCTFAVSVNFPLWLFGAFTFLNMFEHEGWTSIMDISWISQAFISQQRFFFLFEFSLTLRYEIILFHIHSVYSVYHLFLCTYGCPILFYVVKVIQIVNDCVKNSSNILLHHLLCHYSLPVSYIRTATLTKILKHPNIVLLHSDLARQCATW